MAHSDGNSFEEIMERCLSNSRLANIDKRQGSVIYDTLAPLCLELAEAYVKMDIMDDQSYLLTATGINLDNKVYDYGLVREQATYAERVGVFKGYLINSSNESVYEYEYVGPDNGDYDQVDDEYEYVGKGNGKYLKSTNVYTYEGDDSGDYTLSATYEGANKGSFLYNATDNIYIEVGEGKGNYNVSAVYVGEGLGDYSHVSNGYGLIGEHKGDYNEAYENVGEGNGQYVRGERVLVDITIPVGSRFSIPNNADLIFYFKEVRSLYNQEDDLYEDYNILQCESPGIGGNGYTGTIIALTPVINLVDSRVEDVVTTARNDESDDDLRQRAFEYINNVAFGGNQSDYINKLKAMDGVGAVKVFPAYIDENKAVMSFKASDDHPIATLQVANIGTIVRLHSQYVYVGSGGNYNLVNNEYVEAENGEYDIIENSYPITSVSKLQFDGSVKVSILNDDFNPVSSLELARIQDEVDPIDYTGQGFGIAPIGHYVSVVTPNEDSVSVTLAATLKSGAIEAVEYQNIKNSISNYINSIRKEYGADDGLPLQVIVSTIITRVRAECPNVTNVTGVTLISVKHGTSTNIIVYEDTPYEQLIPKLGQVTINGTVVGD